MVLTIAMDGPVGAGKSSVADEVARRLGILHLDTGAMYRAFAWQALKEGIDTNNAQALAALAERTMPEVRFEGCAVWGNLTAHGSDHCDGRPCGQVIGDSHLDTGGASRLRWRWRCATRLPPRRWA